MKRSPLLLAAVALIVALAVVACEGPVGPEGPEGPDGSPNVQTVLSAYLSGNQYVSSGETETVEFDAVVVDEHGGLDTTTGEYSVPAAGDYHVSAGIDWRATFDEGDEITYQLRVNEEQVLDADTTARGGAESHEYQNLSRSLPDLSEGDTIDITVEQDSGTNKDVWGTSSPGETFMTIDRLE